MKWCIGHDDGLTVRVNDQPAQELKEFTGFQSSIIQIDLQAGRNRVEITFENHENVNWRRPGFSLALNAPSTAGADPDPRARRGR